MANIKINQQALRTLPEQANRQIQDLIRGVNAEMPGGDVDEIQRTLLSRMRAQGMQPNEPEIRKYAEAISDGTLKG